jgi:hypothetical protein
MFGANKLTLTGEVLGTGAMQFTVNAEPICDTLTPCSHRTKEQRRGADEALRQRRLAEIKERCAAPCLLFSWRDGWGVAPSSVPDLAAGVSVKRHRLCTLGRPAFLLFAVPTGWCARMVAVCVETHDDLPWKAVDTLRHAYVRYMKQQDDRRLQTNA